MIFKHPFRNKFFTWNLNTISELTLAITPRNTHINSNNVSQLNAWLNTLIQTFNQNNKLKIHFAATYILYTIQYKYSNRCKYEQIKLLQQECYINGINLLIQTWSRTSCHCISFWLLHSQAVKCKYTKLTTPRMYSKQAPMLRSDSIYLLDSKRHLFAR